MICIFLGMFYYTIANLPPALRSAHRCIQLIAVISCPLLVNYGFREVLKPFINDVKKLYTVSNWYVHNCAMLLLNLFRKVLL